jgi:hypothetical protein
MGSILRSSSSWLEFIIEQTMADFLCLILKMAIKILSFPNYKMLMFQFVM